MGREVEVLVEGPSRKGNGLSGRAPDNRVVNFPVPEPEGAGFADWAGAFCTVRITGYGPNSLLGALVRSAGRPRPLPDFTGAPPGAFEADRPFPLPVIQPERPAAASTC